MLRIATCLVAALACAPLAQAQSTILPGTYDLEITFGGGQMAGSIEITAATRDSITVTLFAGGHESPVRLTRREGATIVLDSRSAGLEIHYELTFSGETVSGRFTYEGQEGTVTGRRRRTGS